MKALTLLLSLLIVLDVRANYSIIDFLNYLQEKGYYDIIVEVKRYFGKDVAIEICKGLVSSGDCEQLVRIYIPNTSRGDDEGMKTLESIIFNPDNYDIYKDNAESYHYMIERIKQKYNIEYN